MAVTGGCQRGQAIARGGRDNRHRWPHNESLDSNLPWNSLEATEMGEWRCFSAETWAGDREGFLFRCDVPRRGDRWTFRVQASALRALGPADSQAPGRTGRLKRAERPDRCLRGVAIGDLSRCARPHSGCRSDGAAGTVGGRAATRAGRGAARLSSRAGRGCTLPVATLSRKLADDGDSPSSDGVAAT